MSDQLVWVKFRREKTPREVEHDGTAAGRWLDLGEMSMLDVPIAGEYIFINSQQFLVVDRAWSLRIPPKGQPNFLDPQVLLTLKAQSPDFTSSTPREDFFEE